MKPEMFNRRRFLSNGALALAGFAGADSLALLWRRAGGPEPLATFALMTDVHYADQSTRGSRHYRDSIAKMRRTAAAVGDEQIDFAVELGDLIDAGGGEIDDDAVQRQIEYLNTIEAEFAKCADSRHYIFGNHCVDVLTKGEFADNCTSRGEHYSFDQGGVRFVVLDACFNSDGQAYARRNFHWQDTNIPESQLEWLRADLDAADGPVIVFTHQRLDPTESHSVKNAQAVREVLEACGTVAAVFQGHSHQNVAREVEGIHYVVARGMIEGPGLENNGYAVVRVFDDGSIRVEGFDKQSDHDLG